jgi:uncharacterized repeat protein (TIGR03843 family)
VLVHADHPRVRLMAAFDVVVNNADRKGGHVLHAVDGAVYGVDHGICLHTDDKLRTVLWGWAREPLNADDARDLRLLGERLRDRADPLASRLRELLDDDEVRALHDRVATLLRVGRMPRPSQSRPAIPWPAF